MESDLRHLGRQSSEPVDELDVVAWDGRSSTRVVLHAMEFTSRCPVTDQPDYAEIGIEYVPAAWIAETKSVKLWLQRYRDRAQFNEAIVDELACGFYAQVKPRWVIVVGRFNRRGGIWVEAVASYPE